MAEKNDHLQVIVRVDFYRKDSAHLQARLPFERHSQNLRSAYRQQSRSEERQPDTHERLVWNLPVPYNSATPWRLLVFATPKLCQTLRHFRSDKASAWNDAKNSVRE